MVIAPQKGAQEEFLSSNADIAIYGGAAGGGKTAALIMEPLHYINVPGYNATFFRRTSPEITAPGGLWDEAIKFYSPLGAQMIQTAPKQARFTHAKCDFRHLQYDSDVYNWQGAQLCCILWDELTHFSKNQFFYMLSRNRSMCGVRPYVRATCNPDPDHWLADFMEWYIDQDTGFPIPERSGRMRYFVRVGDSVMWAGQKKPLLKHIELTDDDREAGINPESLIKSFTFISASIYDNRILLDNDPGYLASLKSLPEVERQQLLYGNWRIKRTKGDFFRRYWFTTLQQAPPASQVKAAVRGWDRAATEKTENNNPDWTVGVLLLQTIDDEYIIADVQRFRERPARRDRYILETARQDIEKYPFARQIIEQDPGQAGVAESDALLKMFLNNGIPASAEKVGTKKYTRALPFSSACENGFVCIVRGSWNDNYILELEQFSDNERDYSHDDQIDATSVAFNQLNGRSAKTYSLTGINTL